MTSHKKILSTIQTIYQAEKKIRNKTLMLSASYLIEPSENHVLPYLDLL